MGVCGASDAVDTSRLSLALELTGAIVVNWPSVPDAIVEVVSCAEAGPVDAAVEVRLVLDGAPVEDATIADVIASMAPGDAADVEEAEVVAADSSCAWRITFIIALIKSCIGGGVPRMGDSSCSQLGAAVSGTAVDVLDVSLPDGAELSDADMCDEVSA